MAVTPEGFAVRTINGRKYLTVRRAQSIAQHIIFPGDGPEDSWKCAARSKLIEEIEGMFRKGYFDVCPINNAISNFKLISTISTKKAMENLMQIHCVNFDKLTPEIFEAIPRHITHIFTEGRVPLEPIEREGELESLNESSTGPSPAVKELADVLADALLALESGGTTPETMEALKARQSQALESINQTFV